MAKRHKYTQDYPTERKDYPSSIPRANNVHPLKKPPELTQKKKENPTGYQPIEGNPDEGGKISPADAERISSEDLPPVEEKENHRPKAA